jgi:hypothetical protein
MSATVSTPSIPPWRLQPVRGTCGWLNRDCRLLRINHAVYTLVPVEGGYRLRNWATGRIYDIDADGRSCSCPSYVWDHCPIQAGGDGRCKHIAALRTLGVLPSHATSG